MSVIYAWCIGDAPPKDVDKFDQALYDPPRDDLRENAPGWSDEETFDSFVAASTTLQKSSSTLGVRKGRS